MSRMNRVPPYCCQPNPRVYEDYYMHQAGHGLPVFMGARRQRGHGLGSILSGLLRTVTPLLKRGAKALGKRALKTGMQIAGDVIQGKNVKKAAKRRLKQMGADLVTKALQQVAPPGQPAKKRRISKPIKKKAHKKRVSSRRRNRANTSRADIFG